MTYEVKTRGVCSRSIIIDVDNNIVRSVRYNGGCNGNTQGIAKLVEGMRIDDVITRLQGINCGGRGTSCPDQLAKALEKALQQAQEQ